MALPPKTAVVTPDHADHEGEAAFMVAASAALGLVPGLHGTPAEKAGAVVYIKAFWAAMETAANTWRPNPAAMTASTGPLAAPPAPAVGTATPAAPGTPTGVALPAAVTAAGTSAPKVGLLKRAAAAYVR